MTLKDAASAVSQDSPRLLSTPLVETRSTSRFAVFLKSGFDLIVVIAALMVFMAPMVLIAIAVKATSPGPILFRQLRVGKSGRFFMSYKFRSMSVDAEDRFTEVKTLNEADGPIFKIKKDPRITGVGRFLRRSSLDELPQMFNVLRGEMSIVGPRPPLMREVVNYKPWQTRRLTVKPGMTGLWQVSGRSALGFDEMMSLDLRYVDQWSIWLDLALVVRTLPAVLSGRGAY